MKPVIYAVVNTSLGMSPGKLAAQVGHAVALVMADYNHDQCSDLWVTQPHRWLIVLEAADGEQLYHLSEFLRERGVPSYRVIDEGVNEIPAFSLTAIGVGIFDKDSAEAAYLNRLPKHVERGYHVYSVPDIDLFDALRRVPRSYLNWRGRRTLDRSI